MLEKLAKQTAVYGISTIVVRFLSYLLKIGRASCRERVSSPV